MGLYTHGLNILQQVQTEQEFLDYVLTNAIYYDFPPPDYLFCNIPCFGSD